MAVILSIIVPVYNVKPYLTKCVESLMDQDLPKEEYEVILVDDGSTDGGGELCDALAARESNVVVVHQVNQGLSCARNTGIRMARGKYLQFVDSDDFIAGNVLGALVRRAEGFELEVLKFGVRRIDEGTSPIAVPPAATMEPEKEEADIMDGPSFLIRHLWYTCYACQFLVLRSFLEGNGLFFKPGIRFEDTEWTPRLMQKASRVSAIDREVYYYVTRSGSITQGATDQVITSLLSRIDDLKGQMEPLEDKRWYRGMVSQMAVRILSAVSLDLYGDRKKYLAALESKEIYPLSSFLATKKARRKIRLINFSPRLACFFIHATNRRG